MEFHIAMTESMNSSLQKFLLKDFEDEEICFAIWYHAHGSSRFSALLHEVVFPKHGERKRHGAVSAFPNYVDRVKELARTKGGGIAMRYILILLEKALKAFHNLIYTMNKTFYHVKFLE